MGSRHGRLWLQEWFCFQGQHAGALGAEGKTQSPGSPKLPGTEESELSVGSGGSIAPFMMEEETEEKPESPITS